MTINYFYTLDQGSQEWLEQRRGVLTASEMDLIITPKTLKKANNDKSRAHLYELAAQRISGFVEPQYISDDMLRGMQDEGLAFDLYEQKYSALHKCGFISNDQWGFKLGYSPDGVLVDGTGLVEIKSRRQKYQIQTIAKDEVPEDYVIQLQTGLLVASDRQWIDFISYCGGLPMYIKRVYRDDVLANAILEAAGEFYGQMDAMVAHYHQQCSDIADRLTATERVNDDLDIL